MIQESIQARRSQPYQQQQGCNCSNFISESSSQQSSTAENDSNYLQLLKQFQANLTDNPLKIADHLHPPDPSSIHNPSLQQSYEWMQDKNQGASLEIGGSLTAELIRQINNQLSTKEADLAYFWKLWNGPDRQRFINNIEFIIQPTNWPLFRKQYEKPLELFLNIFQQKIASTTYLKKLYPGLTELIQKIEIGIQYQPNKQKVRFEERNSLALFEHFLEEIQSKSLQLGAFYIKDESPQATAPKIPIGDYIARSPLFQGSHAWADIFFKASIYKRLEIDARPFESMEMQAERMQERENRNELKERVFNGEEILPAVDYLCCAQYLYFNYRINDRLINRTPLLTERVFSNLCQTAEKGPSEELLGTIIDICALLNSGGGVILFNTFRNYLQVWPKGEIMEQAQQKAVKELITRQLQNIYPLQPRICMDKHIFISFVPVVRNPIADGFPATGRSFIEGLYALRIVVRPPEDHPEQLYFYSRDPQDFQAAIVSGNSARVLKKTELTKFMKQRFNYYYIPEKDYSDAEELAMLRREYSRFAGHEHCLPPQKGIPLIHKITRVRNQSDQILESKYKYITLLVSSRSFHPKIQQKLRGKGIECQIIVKYAQYKFKAANNSAALFHNARFDILLNEIAYKKQFEFNGRFILTILVTNYVKLTQRSMSNILPQEQFNTLENWLKTEHPKATLKLWRYEDEDKNYQFYIQTTTKLATLFMYYVMNHYNQKCSFKNPRNYERLSQNEKDARMMLYYPRPPTTTTN